MSQKGERKKRGGGKLMFMDTEETKKRERERERNGSKYLI